MSSDTKLICGVLLGTMQMVRIFYFYLETTLLSFVFVFWEKYITKKYLKQFFRFTEPDLLSRIWHQIKTLESEQWSINSFFFSNFVVVTQLERTLYLCLQWRAFQNCKSFGSSFIHHNNSFIWNQMFNDKKVEYTQKKTTSL